MGANTDLERVVCDLFRPVEQSLQDLPDDRQAYARAQRSLQEAVVQLDAAADEEWLAVAALVNDLLEIAGCAADEAGGIDAVCDDVATGVALLRDALMCADAPTGELEAFAADARGRWSSYLQLLSDDDWDTDPALAPESFSAAETLPVHDATDAASPVDVQMILQALTGGDGSTAAAAATGQP
ncbi:MAG: hypothetical protein ACF8TS_14355, partial [Maioricimonas sp. JB049]